MKINIKKLTGLRQEIHKNPELSDHEEQTAERIREYISQFKPDDTILEIGGYGMAFIFDSRKTGPTLMFRCELDALPIDEINNFSYRSSTYGISHKCGHDGHMTILSGLAETISHERPTTGRVILLFQPAEETGQGAMRVIKSSKFKPIEPDYIFALHNLPGFDKNSVIIKEGVFSSASTGLIARLSGKTSHAAEPEKGLNPAYAIASILQNLESYAFIGKNKDEAKLITPIHVRIGEKAFGTSPGFGEMMYTIRATYTDDFENLKNYALNTIKTYAKRTKLQLEYEWAEEFPNTINNNQCVDIVKKSAENAGMKMIELSYPFRWSEDFGHFLAKYPGALFGLGAGNEHPAVHNPDYDFPDEIIESGVKLFFHIYKSLLF
jgi:amidohydrolase